MHKNLRLALNQYPVIPDSLRVNRSSNTATDVIRVDLAGLYHHYFLDNYGRGPPNPNPAQFEYVQFLLSHDDFRFQGSGLGDSPSSKGHRSNELGQAFCRWFLYEHFNITYFAHVAKVLNRQLHRAFANLTIERHMGGDTPDYFCAERVDRFFLAEAKGRYASIAFKSQEFTRWRKQFQRVIVRDAKGSMVSIKGHIVATRFATEADSARIQTCLFAEDPSTPGSRSPDSHESAPFGAAITALHYSCIAEKLRQPVLAASLDQGIPMPEQLAVIAFVWEVVQGPLSGTRFVGGYFPGADGEPRILEENGRYYFLPANPFRLDSPSATFFGLEECGFHACRPGIPSDAGSAFHGMTGR